MSGATTRYFLHLTSCFARDLPGYFSYFDDASRVGLDRARGAHGERANKARASATRAKLGTKEKLITAYVVSK